MHQARLRSIHACRHTLLVEESPLCSGANPAVGRTRSWSHPSPVPFQGECFTMMNRSRMELVRRGRGTLFSDA
ncbi:hypothetical protein MRX96_053429 [Rhipicephalus microplus]